MQAENKQSDKYQRDSLENTEGVSENRNQPSMQSDDVQNSCDNSPDKEEANSPIHGIVYQLKLSMLFLQTALDKKYSFELYFEKKDAEKFDDVIFKYGKDGKYRFLQAKHKFNPKEGNITIEKLLSENAKEPFNLQKYFISFYRIERKEQYKNKIKDYIICTNTDFSNDIYIEKRLIKYGEDDDILKTVNCIGDSECYKLKFDKKINEDIIEKLREASDLKNLAKELARAFCNRNKEKRLNLHNELLKAYHIALEEKIFDKIPKKDEENRWYYTFKEDFIQNNNLSSDAKSLRDAFTEAVKKMKSNINNLWETLRNTKFDIPPKFGKHMTESVTILPNDVTEDEIEKFFNKLVFAVKQPSKENLDTLIQKKIFRSLDYLKNNDHAELIYDYVQKEILNWLKDSKSKALENEHDFFRKGEEKIKGIMHYITDLEYSCYIKELNIKFNNTSVEIQELSTILNSENKIFNLISSEKNIFLTKAEVYQIKQQSVWELQNILNLKMFGNTKAESLFINNLLIIICKNESQTKHEHIEELYMELVQIIKDHNKKIILITESNSNLAKFFKIGEVRNYYEEKSCQIKIRDLDENYLRKQLMKKKITFQGQERSLAYLLNIEGKVNELNNCELSKEILETLEKVLKSDTLSEFIFNKNIVVANELPNFTDYNSPYYDPYYIDIQRTFSHQIIDENSLKKYINERKKDLFAFSFIMKDCPNILVSEKKHNIRAFSKIDNFSDEEFFEARFFIMDGKDSDTDFKKLRNHYNEKNIHWLISINENNDKFKVKYSNMLLNLQESMKTEYLGKEIKCSSRVIIVGDPGIGKSTVLTMYFQKLNTLSWPIRINLKDHQEYIKTANFNNVNKIIEFLCRSSPKSFKNALAKYLLNYYFECGDRIILLLDGYDEITNDNQEKVIELLRSFPANNKIWLTTRSNQQYRIENALGNASSYFLNPFNEEEQEKFLNEYWIKKLSIKESDKKEQNNIGKFTKKLLEHFQQKGLMTSENLVRIVLQARMIADTCLKYYEKCDVHDSFQFKINNISDLYGKFIEYQYERYFTKIEIDKKSSYNDLRIILTKSYSEIHQYIAMKALFPENQLYKTDYLNQIYKGFPEDTLNNIGLIKNFKDKCFVHYTYAEYFVAKLLINMLSKSKDCLEYKLTHKFLLEHIFLNRNILIRNFFDNEIKNMCYNEECDLDRKWKEIEKCDLLSKMKREPKLEVSKSEKKTGINPLSLFDDENIEIQDNNTKSNKTLDELTKDFESRFDSLNFCYNIQSNTIEVYRLIEKIFQVFHKETNIDMLENVLKFLLKISANSWIISSEIFKSCSYLFSWFQEKLNLSIIYYLIQTRLQKKHNIEIERIIFEDIFKEDDVTYCRKTKLNNFMCFLDELNKYETQRKKLKERDSEKEIKECMQNLIDLLIPNDKSEYSVTKLAELNYEHYYIAKLENIIKDINSIKSFQKLCTKKIIDFLANTFKYVERYPCNTVLTIFEKPCLTYLISFFVDIIHHPNIISYAKQYISETCKKHDFKWLQKQGVLLIRIFKILTPEISKIFNSQLDNILLTYTDEYIKERDECCFGLLILFTNIQNEMINYIVDKMETENLLQIDKLAFLQMIVKFSTTEIKYCHLFYFNLHQVKTILKLIENMLKEKDLLVFKVLESVEFLYMLKKVGLHLIDTSDRILVLDQERNSLFELSSNCNDQIIKLLQWKYKNHKLSKYEFFEKCYNIIETKCGLKRSKSEDSLQELSKNV